MCGIAGYLPGLRRERPTTTELQALGRRLAARLAHRGPDGEGVWVADDARVLLAHRRLAIVGLGDGGAQPMVSASGRLVITYNGELYNAPDLAAGLTQSGRRFRGSSDTEVLLEAIDEWGVDETLRRADGMFAFGVWDVDSRRLTLARDRIGEKPLLYGHAADGFAFASELGALRVVPDIPDRVDPDAVAAYLRFKYVPAPLTAIAGIRKLPPGCTLVVDGDHPGRRAEPVPYWSTIEEWRRGADDPLPVDADVIGELGRHIERSVQVRLRSDVAIGVLLSGGVDSSLVATVAAQHSTEPVRTFTIGSNDPDYDESAAARQFATRIGADHTELVVDATEAVDAVPGLAASFDEPFGDSSALPTLLVAQLARRDVAVVLSGDGGDEVFGGYNRHVWLDAIWRRTGQLPRPIRRGMAAALAAPSPGFWDAAVRVIPSGRRPRLAGVKAGKVAAVLEAESLADAYATVVSHWGDPLGIVPGATNVAGVPSLPTGIDPTAAVMAVDLIAYLPDDILVKVDRATMAVGLEARVPLLAPEVIGFAARLSAAQRVRDGQGKWALRELLARSHPRSIVDRPKSGFGVPVAEWLRGPLRPWAEDLLAPDSLGRSGLLAVEPVRRVWAEHCRGAGDRSYELWDVLMLQSWLAER